MEEIAEILSSGGKFKVLNVLSRHETPLPLRQLSEVAGSSLTSTKYAVDRLKKLSVVKVKRSGNRTLISLARNHPSIPLLLKIFSEIKGEEKHLENLNEKAQKFLKFNTDALEMLREARRHPR